MTPAELIDECAAKLTQAGVSFGQGTLYAEDEAAWLVLWSMGLSLDTDTSLLVDAVTEQQRVVISDLLNKRIQTRQPLAYLTGRQFLASSYYHNLWWYQQLIPDAFLEQGESGKERYLDLYNVSAVLAREERWQKYFADRPAQYRLIWQSALGPAHHHWQLFERRGFTANFFLEGSGQVLEQTSSSVTVRVDAADAVLKFNYFPFLSASACEISGKEVAEDVTFVRLSSCPAGAAVTIRSLPPWARILL